MISSNQSIVAFASTRTSHSAAYRLSTLPFGTDPEKNEMRGHAHGIIAIGDISKGCDLGKLTLSKPSQIGGQFGVLLRNQHCGRLRVGGFRCVCLRRSLAWESAWRFLIKGQTEFHDCTTEKSGGGVMGAVYVYVSRVADAEIVEVWTLLSATGSSIVLSK